MLTMIRHKETESAVNTEQRRKQINNGRSKKKKHNPKKEVRGNDKN